VVLSARKPAVEARLLVQQSGSGDMLVVNERNHRIGASYGPVGEGAGGGNLGAPE
jgi:hypothetical protein